MRRLTLFGMIMFLLTTPLLLFAQSREITGTVRSSEGQVIPGATITQVGTNNATSANERGVYTITVTGTQVNLLATAVGYESATRNAGAATSLNFTLEPAFSDTQEEVFVVAYGTAQRKSFTGAATAISQREIKDIPTTSFEQALTGRLPGVQITTTSGQAGSSSAIRIRGIGSMNASNEPLYVVDGVPIVSGSVGQMGAMLYTSNNIMNTINPNDIESFTVLKDAAASALYGSRAANGVIVITTKRGRLGAPRINFRTSIGFTPEWATDNYEVGTPQEQIDYFYRIFHDYRTSNGATDEAANTYALNRMTSRFGMHGYAFSTAGTGPFETVTVTGKTDGQENRNGRYFDWDDALFRTGVYQTNDLSVSGGRDNTRYYSSISYTTDKGRAYTNEFQRISGRVNLNQRIGQYVDFATNINLSHNNKEGFNDTRNTGTNYLYLSRNMLFPFYWPTNYMTGEPYTTRYMSLGYNPLYYDTQWDNFSKSLRLTANQSLAVNFTPWLTAKTVFSYDNTEVKDNLYYSPQHYHTTYGITANGTVFEYSTNIKKMVSSNTLTFDQDFGVHSLNILGGFETEQNRTDYVRAQGSNLPSSALRTVATAGTKDASSYWWGNNLMSFLSRVEYNFDQKYYLSGSFRRDGSSRLGPDTRWGNFWSLSGAWNLKNEAFLAGNNNISLMKLRASYGVNGTLPSGNYGWRSLASYGYNYNGDAGGQLTTVADANLTWETNYAFNIGLDFGLMEDRLTGTVEYFNRDTRDLLQNVPITTITGFSSTLKNVGAINNKGVELSLFGDILRRGDFRWSASANATFLKSKVITLNEGQDVLWWDPTGGDSRVQFIYREGENVLSYYTPEWAGVDNETGDPIWYTNDPDHSDFIYNGRSATNDVTKAAQVITGTPQPDVFGGFNTDFGYKGLTLGFNFMYKIGGTLFDAGSRDVAEDGYYWERVRSYYGIRDSWTPNNPEATLPKVRGTDPTDGITRSSRHMYDASFLRLKNVNLAYSLPQQWTQKIRLNSARVFFNGTNLLTFSKFKWADPEVNHYGTRGWETPFGKTYTFGLEVNL